MAAGYDFSSFTGTRLAWNRLIVFLNCIDERYVQKLAELEVICAAGSMAATDVDIADRNKYVTEKLEAYRNALIPWLSSASGKTMDIMDPITSWYAMFAPDHPVDPDG